MSDFTEKKISRRTVAKGAAWSVPVVAVAAAAPAHAASATDDVVVSASCHSIATVDLSVVGLGQVGVMSPGFSVAPTGSPLGSGSTFTLSGAGLANLTLAGPDSSLISLSALSDSSATLTTNQDIAAGATASFWLGGIASVSAVETYTLTLTSPVGNANSVTNNDAASQSSTGVSVANFLSDNPLARTLLGSYDGFFIGSCQ